MDNKQGRAIGGSLLGGLVGGLAGIVLGGFLGPVFAGVHRHPQDSIFGLFDTCVGLVFALIGAVVGGVICAVSGAALGAGLATSSKVEQPFENEDDERPRAEGPAPASEESTETELTRLKEKVAELEARKDKQEDHSKPG